MVRLLHFRQPGSDHLDSFPGVNPTASFLKTLVTFAVGVAVRPFGALVFGRIGDLVGRKIAFLTTLLIMGGSTAAIGFLPSYERIGLVAPVILVVLRLLQGLALGGEYGGAAVYVAEQRPIPDAAITRASSRRRLRWDSSFLSR